MQKLFLVSIKSEAVFKEDKKALLIPMSMDKKEVKNNTKEAVHNALIRDAIKLYPNYTKKEDNPIISISEISRKDYNRWIKTGVLKQKSYLGFS